MSRPTAETAHGYWGHAIDVTLHIGIECEFGGQRVQVLNVMTSHLLYVVADDVGGGCCLKHAGRCLRFQCTVY